MPYIYTPPTCSSIDLGQYGHDEDAAAHEVLCHGRRCVPRGREPVLTRVRFVQAISLGLLLGFVFFRCVGYHTTTTPVSCYSTAGLPHHHNRVS